MAKQVVLNEEARRALMAGIEQVAEAVESTLGPKGRHVALGKKYGAPIVTHDGVTVAKEIELEDGLQTSAPSSSRKQRARPTMSPVTAPRPRPCSRTPS